MAAAENAKTSRPSSNLNSYLNEVRLCREASNNYLPPALVALYENNEPKHDIEALAVALHLLQKECGFVPYSDSEKSADDLNQWNKTGFYKLLYKRPECNDAIAMVTCVNIGDSVMVSGTVLDGDEVCVLKLKTAKFIKKIDVDPINVYTSLPKLSLQFKNNISIQLTHLVREKAGVEVDSGLGSLPYELQLSIMSNLDAASCTRMMLVSKAFCAICKEPFVWRSLYLRKFDVLGDNKVDQDWYRYFKDKVEEFRFRAHLAEEARKADEEMARRERQYICFNDTMPSNFNNSPLIHVIGGDYDMDPFGGFSPDAPFGQRRPPSLGLGRGLPLPGALNPRYGSGSSGFSNWRF